MSDSTSSFIKTTLPIALAFSVVAACTDTAATAPRASVDAAFSNAPEGKASNGPLAVLERATVRYKNLDAALADGFVLLHGCEVRPDEGPVGAVYYHPQRLLDGVIDPATPDALIYEPRARGRAKLVGIEFAVPYQLWNSPTPPSFLGNTFYPEDEFGVYALHVWIWRKNPDGLFAESNPRVSCEGES